MRDADAADLPIPDRVYRSYRRTCRRLKIKPVPRERALAAIQQWADALAAARAVPPHEGEGRGEAGEPT